jgi:hypothetical protein
LRPAQSTYFKKQNRTLPFIVDLLGLKLELGTWYQEEVYSFFLNFSLMSMHWGLGHEQEMVLLLVVVAHTCNPSYWDVAIRRIVV